MYVIDGSNRVKIGFYDRVWNFIAPLEIRSGHGSENKEPGTYRDRKKC